MTRSDLVETIRSGGSAVASARATERRAIHGDADPLRDLAARVERKEADPYDPAVLEAAAKLDGPAREALAAALKAAGVPISGWRDAVKSTATAARKRAKAAEQERSAEEAAAAERAAAAARAAAAEQRAAASAAADAARAAHYVEAERDHVVYAMEPGATTATSEDDHGRPVTATLAGFSCVIAEEVLEYDAPDAQPRRVLALSIVPSTSPDATPIRQEIDASALMKMDWPERILGRAAAVNPAKGTRDRLRLAISLCSRGAVTRRRYRYTGWERIDGRAVFVTPGCSIGADGPLPNVDCSPAGAAARFGLPPPLAGDELRAALAHVVAMLEAEPAVVVPILGTVFRGALGPSSLTTHVTGRKGTGKSLLTGIAQSFFGVATCAPSRTDGFVAQWTDSSTARGLMRTLSTIGGVGVVDDLRVSGARDDVVYATYDMVIRAHFNRAAPVKLTREGQIRDERATRCTLITSGEVLPHGHSTTDRIVAVHLDKRLGFDLSGVVAASNAGALAGAMAAFIGWWARSLDAGPRDLERMAAETAGRWSIGADDRAVKLLGAVAVGIEAMLMFACREGALDEASYARHHARAVEAMREVSGTHLADVASEDPARVACAHLGSMLRAGRAHIVRYVDGRPCQPAADPSLWGWSVRGGGHEGVTWVPQGLCIGRVTDGVADEVLLEPAMALAAARQMAAMVGKPLALTVEGMGAAFRAAGVLSRVGGDGILVQARMGTTRRVRCLAVRADALGSVLDPDPVTASGTDQGGPVTPDP